MATEDPTAKEDTTTGAPALPGDPEPPQPEQPQPEQPQPEPPPQPEAPQPEQPGAGEAPAPQQPDVDPSQGGNQAGDGIDPIESPQQGQEQERQCRASLVSPQAGQPAVAAEDPRGDSPRSVAPSGFVVHGVPGADHPNQSVQPTRYAFEMTEWLGLSHEERKNKTPPEPPEGCAPHPLAKAPVDRDDGCDLGQRHVILKP